MLRGSPAAGKRQVNVPLARNNDLPYGFLASVDSVMHPVDLNTLVLERDDRRQGRSSEGVICPGDPDQRWWRSWQPRKNHGGARGGRCGDPGAE